MSLPLPAAFLAFIARFNRGEFWESHEVLEAPWRRNGSDFYKGLILLASAWVHVQRENPRGVRAQFAKTERHLGTYAPTYLGLDVAALLAHAERGRRIAEAPDGMVPPDGWAQRISRIELHPEPALIRGDEPELWTR